MLLVLVTISETKYQHRYFVIKLMAKLSFTALAHRQTLFAEKKDFYFVKYRYTILISLLVCLFVA